MNFCKYCGVEFIKNKFNQLYCCKKCRSSHCQKRYRKRNNIKTKHISYFLPRKTVTLECNFCKKGFIFTGTRRQIKLRKFCCKKCGIKSWAEKFKLKNGIVYSAYVRKLFPVRIKYLEGICKECGIKFWVAKRELKKKKFCCAYCRQKNYKKRFCGIIN